MKRTLLVLTLLSPLAAPTFGQVNQAETMLADPAVAASYAARTAAFWDALETQLLRQMKKPTAAVDAPTLQNLVYFANRHADQMNLSPAAPALIRVYREHHNPRFRVMAVAALHAIGDEHGMLTVFQSFRSQDSPLVRQVSLGALRSYYRTNLRGAN